MKARLIDAAAFVIGTIPAFMLGGLTGDVPWPVRLALSLVSPGYVVGLPLCYLVGAIGLFSFRFFFLVAVLANGLIFALASYLIRNALKGQRPARLALSLGMGSWITWGVVWGVNAMRAEPPPAPVNLASPLAGRWEGVLHAPRGDCPITLVCHPRADSTLDGYLYVRGGDMGPFENGVYARDSLHFGIIGFEYSAHFDGTAMAMVASVARSSDRAELRFVSADTSRPAPASVDLASPLAGRWDGMLHAPSGDRPITLVYHPRTDGTLEGYFYSGGAELGRLWDGGWSGDSLHFRLERIPYRAHFDRTTMALEWSIEGNSRSMELRFVGADTSRPARPQPNRFMGQLPH